MVNPSKIVGCLSHPQAREHLNKEVIAELERHLKDIVERRSTGDESTYRYVIRLVQGGVDIK